MTLFADRFVMIARGRGIDLATGAAVSIKIAVAGDAADQTAWAERCDAQYRHHVRGRDALVDYGPIGQAHRFEAWGVARRTSSCSASCTAATFEEVLRCWTGARVHVVPVDLGRMPCEGIAEAVARVARIQGFIPLASRMVGRVCSDEVAHRSVCLIVEDDADRRWRSGLVRLALMSPRPHVAIVAATDSQPSSVARAERASGPSRGRKTLRVAEQAVVYGETPPVDVGMAADVEALRADVAGAVRLFASGRPARAERGLREAVAALARRGMWRDAGGAGLALGSALISRGRPGDADRVLDAVADYAHRGDDAALSIRTAALAAHGWMERGQLDRAESVVSAALVAGRPTVDREVLQDARAALARALFWKGEFDEAWLVARQARAGDIAETEVRFAALSARIAAATGDLPRALECARRALATAEQNGRLATSASASEAAAFVYMTVGDPAQAAGHAERGAAIARTMHDRIGSIRMEVLRVFAEWRSGREALARRLSTPLSRMGRRLPALLRARVEIAVALVTGGLAAAGDAADRHARQLGVPGLRLYRFDPPVRSTAEWNADDVTAVVRECQTEAHERDVLAKVCARLRERLHATAVALVWRERGRATAIAGDVGRVDAAFGDRLLDAGIPVAPCRCADRIDAGAPVVHGGRTLAAFVVRWPLGTPYELSAAPPLLSVAAVAVGPLVAAMRAHEDRPPAASPLDAILGVSPATDALRGAVQRAAPAPFAVLVEGESGSGKELVARAIHRLGGRRDRAFCALNCAAIPDDLVESELFGHARGAFTGALVERAGAFEEAHGGTMFLDEVAELSLRAQAKLLRVVQEGEFRRIGENVARRADVRIVSATNRDLREDARTGRFRQDLVYRLDVVRIRIPPLRERQEDIVLLAEHYWRVAAGRVGSRAMLASATLAALARYDWPGNVRELQNVMAALAVRAPKRGTVPPTALPVPLGDGSSIPASRLEEARRAFDERFVRAALVRTGGHRGRAADELGVTRQGLAKLMVRLGIEV